MTHIFTGIIAFACRLGISARKSTSHKSYDLPSVVARYSPYSSSSRRKTHLFCVFQVDQHLSKPTAPFNCTVFIASQTLFFFSRHFKSSFFAPVSGDYLYLCVNSSFLCIAPFQLIFECKIQPPNIPKYFDT